MADDQADLFGIDDLHQGEADPDATAYREEDIYRFSMTAAEVALAARGTVPARIQLACWVAEPCLRGDLAEHARRMRAERDGTAEQEIADQDVFVLTTLGEAVAAHLAATRPDIVADVQQKLAKVEP